MRVLLMSAPQDIRERLLKTKTAECVANCARLRSLGETPMLQTLATTLRLLAKRYLALTDELKTLDAMLERLTLKHARRLRERFGVGPQTAAVLVAVAGDKHVGADAHDESHMPNPHIQDSSSSNQQNVFHQNRTSPITKRNGGTHNKAFSQSISSRQYCNAR
ncbi:hypothetical protein WN985_29790 [Burkholderia pyrrocinia]|uniref:Transposase IS116/IS110/IS902 family protein n=1 Tax=Burkholderia pyrrocinia TaxID=60550 RepID=A0ABZ3BNW3_BURPY